jgi:1-phosphofructokinase family hexose kinase
VLIACPNLTIDRTHRLPELRPGTVLRSRDVLITAGGKGVNVARAASALGAPARLVGFLPGHTGRAAGAMLADEGVDLRGVPAAGELRSAQVILEDGGRATVLNEPGPPVSAAGWSALEAAVEAGLGSHRALVCSGSLPPGAPPDGYGRLAELVRVGGARWVVVDTAGEALGGSLGAGPDVVTPNLGEAEGLLAGRGVEDVEVDSDAEARALAAAEALVGRGARAAIVTAAAAGAAVAWGGAGSVWLAAPSVRVRNPIGAGDVFTAAVAAALERGETLIDAARAAVAAAAASVEAPRAGDLDPGRAASLLAGLTAGW